MLRKQKVFFSLLGPIQFVQVKCLSCCLLWCPQLLHLQSSCQYLSVSKGGTVAVWDAEDVSLLRTHRLQNSTVSPKDLWVTDVVLLPNAHKVTFISKKERKESNALSLGKMIDWCPGRDFGSEWFAQNAIVRILYMN